MFCLLLSNPTLLAATQYFFHSYRSCQEGEIWSCCNLPFVFAVLNSKVAVVLHVYERGATIFKIRVVLFLSTGERNQSTERTSADAAWLRIHVTALSAREVPKYMTNSQRPRSIRPTKVPKCLTHPHPVSLLAVRPSRAARKCLKSSHLKYLQH